MVKVHVVVAPGHAAFDHLSTAKPGSGVAVSVTVVPIGIGTTLLVHPAPQFMPPTLEVTVPEPCLLRVRSAVSGTNHTDTPSACAIAT